jgi:hypothetical protein
MTALQQQGAVGCRSQPGSFIVEAGPLPCQHLPAPFANTTARFNPVQDGTAKMSKSAENDASRINLTDDAAAIASKIKRCKTDAAEGLEFGNPDRPEASNLLTLYMLSTGKSKVRRRSSVRAMQGCRGAVYRSEPSPGETLPARPSSYPVARDAHRGISGACLPFLLPKSQEEVAAECSTMRWGTFKPLLADALVEHLAPIQARYNEAVSDPIYLDSVLARGAEAAAEQANATLAAVRDAMGFVRPARRF